MGGKESKPISLSYEEALKRVNEAELSRLKDAYKRSATLNGSLTKLTFVKEVLGDSVSPQLGELIFYGCGGSAKGIAFKDLFCSLVLLTRGNREEKERFIFGVYANENGSHVYRSEMLGQLRATEDGYISESVHKLFSNSDKATYDDFRLWLVAYPNATTITRWLLDDQCSVSLSNELETPTFYQTLAGVTHLEELEILELEKRYWALKGLSPLGRLDPDTLVPMMSPPLLQVLARGVFAAFDENRDNHIDFKEMACGISAACRGPLSERHKFCFKVFDQDRDGKLNNNELFVMCQSLLQLREDELDYNQEPQSPIPSKSHHDVCYGIPTTQVELQVEEILKKHDPSGLGYLSQEEFLIWTLNDSLTPTFLNMIFQVCHIVLGLKPRSPSEEWEIVLSWLLRAERKALTIGQFWYIVSWEWWNSWLLFVSNNENSPTSNLSANVKKTRFQKVNLEGCVAMDSSSVVITSISSLNPEENEVMPSGKGDVTDGDATGNQSSGLQRTQSSASVNSHSKKLSSASSSTLTVTSVESRGNSPSHSPCLPRRPVGSAGSTKTPSRPSAIDNSALLENSLAKIPHLTNEGGRLKRNVALVQGKDFVLVPDSLWKVLQQWYGGSPALPRQVIHGRSGGEVELELYPITLKILRHPQVQNRSAARYAPNNWVGLGGYGSVMNSSFYSSTLPLSNVGSKRNLAYVASFSRLASLRQIYDFLANKLRLRKEDFRLWHVREEPAGMTLLEEEEQTLEDAGLGDLSQVLLEVRNKDLTWPEEMSQISRSVSSYSVRSSKHIQKGVTGLNNLGNTCFLNAALQCCSNTVPLNTYFTRGMHLYELNVDNPCGTMGHMARYYGALMKEIWNGEAKTVAPLKLRWAIEKYSGNFTTLQQQDSQELLAFLLDGLHEDLNRVHHKPYTELKDSEGRPDTLVAQEAWENHILRNKSVIVDLFHGQLKSKVTCGVCGNESARFDPFSYLTLPLPMESYVFMEVVVIRLDGSTPVKYGLRLISDAKYRDVKWHLSALTVIPPERFMLTELASSQIKVVLSDESRIRGGSCVYFGFELPDWPRDVTSETRASVTRSAKDRQLLSHIQRSTYKSSPCLNTLNPKDGSDTKSDDSNSQLSLESIDTAKDSPALNRTSDSVDGLNMSFSDYSPSHVHPTSNSAPSSLLRPTCDSEHTEKGIVIAMHRKMTRQEVYFLSPQKTKPSLFGLPLLVPCRPSVTTNQDLYQSVWTLVTRLVSPLPPSESSIPNHAQDCDDSLGYEFPFVLRVVGRNGLYCAQCPWYRFCRGCQVPCDPLPFTGSPSFLAVDWDPTALHLRYQSSLEKVFDEHSSVKEMLRKHKEPISLADCLDAFCSDETLEYSCEKCQKVQQVQKKLQIWRLPPVLIVHLKRFQSIGNKWVKSQKIVEFPLKNFDPTDYLASVPRQTILLHRAELEGVDPDTYVAGLNEKDNVFLERVPEFQIMERLLQDRASLSASIGDDRNGSAISKPMSADESSLGDKRRRMRNGSVLYGDTLQDFHQHRLLEGHDPLDLKYNLYAIACHSGNLDGGHYVCYAKNNQGKWICFNDSSCKEVSESELDLQSAYLLFYERDGISTERYMPNVAGKTPLPEEDPNDSDELRKQCAIM